MARSIAARPLRRALLAGAAMAAIGTGALAASDAQAAFTLGRCEGAQNVLGVGASFQNALHRDLNSAFASSVWCGGLGTSPTLGTWAGDGSGAGRRALGSADGVRDPRYSFGGADEAPSAREMATMNAGPRPDASDDAQVRVIPIATGASAFILHVPEGCSIDAVANKTNGADGMLNGAFTGDNEADETQRLRLTGEQLEQAFAGEVATWEDIAPGIDGDPTGIAGGDQTNAALADCGDVPIRRIVRQDSSGTTYGWKQYLNLVDRTRGWNRLLSSTANIQWPALGGGAAVNPQAAANGAACPVTGNRLCSATDRGGGNLARLVFSTDGSIGYVDLAAARSNGFTMAPRTADQTYWSPLEVDPASPRNLYAEPTRNATAHFAVTERSARGANCSTATVTGAPTAGDPSLGDWSGAYAAGGAGYPACVLTYAMAWDDSAPAYGVTDAEQAKARTVKDYLTLLVGPIGQGRLEASDYSPLPETLSASAMNAVAQIDWNKRSGGGEPQPPTPQPPTPQPPTPGPETRPNTPTPQPVSNQFSIPSRRSSASQLTFTVELPGAGALAAVATTRSGRRTIRVASASATATGAGRVTVRLNLSAAAKRALARARSRRLKIDVAFTYTPNGGSARTVTQSVTVRAAARRAARRGGRGRGRGRRAGKKQSAKR